MNYGKANLIAGAIGLLLAGMGGMALGATFDTHSVKDGYHMLSIVRFFLREGHSHGMPIALFNLLVGSFVDRLALPDRWKRVCSIAAILGLVLPIGLAANGAAIAARPLAYIGPIGVFGIFTSAVLIFCGAYRLKPHA